MIAHDLRHGGGSVIVWVGVTMTRRTELLISQGNVTGFYYRNNVVERIVVPRVPWAWEYTQLSRRSRAHRARVVQDHLRFRRITTLPWPAKSPDLSPIEHWWDVCPETASPATGHQRARWCTPGEMATRYWNFCQTDILTLTKLEVRLKSRDSLTSVLLVIIVLSLSIKLMRFHEILIWFKRKRF